MPKLKRNVGPLLQKAIDSLTLGIELFNRPSEVGRIHGVLILLQHAFEMLLKATILQRTGKVHDQNQKYTYSFDRCLVIAAEELKVLTKDERRTLSILDAQRDQAAHYYSEVSEDLLYVHAQSSVTLFDHLLQSTFSQTLAKRIPSRVLPVSTRPPKDMTLLFDRELSEIDLLLEPGKRQGAKALARLRSVLAVVTGSRDAQERVSERELLAAVAERRKGKDWEIILPEVAQLKLTTEGSGIPISMRISKDAPIAVRVAQPGEEVFGTLIKKEVNLWDVFTLSRDDLADKIGLTGPRTHALIYELELQKDPNCYRELKKKKLILKGYSKKALDLLLEARESVDMDKVWQRHKHKLGGPRTPKKQGQNAGVSLENIKKAAITETREKAIADDEPTRRAALKRPLFVRRRPPLVME